jgi:hypothetical protein
MSGSFGTSQKTAAAEHRVSGRFFQARSIFTAPRSGANRNGITAVSTLATITRKRGEMMIESLIFVVVKDREGFETWLNPNEIQFIYEEPNTFSPEEEKVTMIGMRGREARVRINLPAQDVIDALEQYGEILNERRWQKYDQQLKALDGLEKDTRWNNGSPK